MANKQFNSKIILWIFILLFVVSLTIGIIYYYLNTENFHSTVKSILIQQLESALEKRIEIQSINSISFQFLEATGLTIFGSSPTEEEVLFQAGKIKVGFTFLFSLLDWKNWSINIHDLTFYQVSIHLTRNPEGEIDLFNQFRFEVGEDQQNLSIEQIYFEDSEFFFHDRFVSPQNHDPLTTHIKQIQGLVDLSLLPEITFEFQGKQDIYSSDFAIQGKVRVDEPSFSLDLHLKNGSIVYFQPYFEDSDSLNITQGYFDLNLNLIQSSETETNQLLWQGVATFNQINIQPTYIEGILLRNINGSVELDNQKVTIHELQAYYRDYPVFLKGSLSIEPEINFDLNVVSEKLSLSILKNDLISFMPDLNIDDFSLEGVIDFNANISGKRTDYEFTGEIFSPEFAVENVPFKNVDLDFSLNSIGLLNLSLISQDSESPFLLSGQADLSEEIPFYHFSLEMNQLSLKSPLFRSLSIPEDLFGTLSGQFEIENTQDDSMILQLGGDFSISSLTTKDFSLSNPLTGNLQSEIRLVDGIFELIQGELTYLQNKASIDGSIQYLDPPFFALDFEGQIPEIDILISSLDLETGFPSPEGFLSLEGRIQGPVENLRINSGIHLQDGSLENYLLGDMRGEIVFEKDTLWLEEFEWVNRDIDISGNGNILLADPEERTIDLFYQINSANLDSLVQTFTESIPLTGLANGNGQIFGVWPALTLQGFFQFEQMFYDQYSLGNSQMTFNLQPDDILSTEARREDQLSELFLWTGHSYSLQLEMFELKQEKMEIDLSGRAELKDRLPFSLTGDFSHQNLVEIVRLFYTPDNETLESFLSTNLSGEAKLNGYLDEQQIELSIQLIPHDENHFITPTLESIITRNQENLTISNFRFTQPDGELTAEGNINFDQELDISFQARQFSLDSLLGLTQIDEDVGGILNFEGHLQGTVNQPELSVITEISQGYYRELHFNQLQGDFFWDSQLNDIEIRNFIVILPQDYKIQAKGNLPLNTFVREPEETSSIVPTPDIPLDFQIQMEKVNLDIFSLFWEDTFSETTGNFDLNFTLSGSSSRPVLDGNIVIHQGQIRLKDLPIDFEELNTIIEINHNQVVIPPVHFSVFENSFNLSGGFELISLSPENIAITIQNDEKKIIYENAGEFDAELLAEIKGSLLDSGITGQLVLTNGILNVDQLQGIGIEGIPVDPAPDTSGILQGCQVDFRMDIQDPFALRLPNAEIFISGNISLSGRLNNVDVRGDIVLRRGFLLYFEKRFDILDGRAAVNGLSKEGIDINAMAQTTVQDILITIHVSGNLANPQIRLSSQPSLLETEIISLLTLGRNLEGLSRGEIDQLLSQEMIDILFQSIQFNLLRQFERELAGQLGLDTLRLSTENIGNSDHSLDLLEKINLANLTLEVGKSFGEDFFITYTTPLDFQGEKRISIDYQLSPDFTLNTQFESYSIRDNEYRFQFGIQFNF